MTNEHTIAELYKNEEESLLDVLIPFLKDKVSIMEKTKKPNLSADMLDEDTMTKVLYHLLGEKVISLSFPDAEQHGVSSVELAPALYITKNQSDGVFNKLKKEKIIEPTRQGGKGSGGKVFYHIPDHKVLKVIKTLETKHT